MTAHVTVSPMHEEREDGTVLRPSNDGDGAAIWKLIKNAGVLDLNSSYQYLMWCKYFSSTTVIAEQDETIVGFISAYILPESPDVVFVWQVAVDESQRGRGLGTAMLHHLLGRKVCRSVRFLEATVSPSNVPSQSLFKKLANTLHTECEVDICFASEQFPEDQHEDEMTYRIGPMT
ncbi:diaminobutyrate acetyltransferase [Tuberibacillus sp. Marseille-P3662]|uniref:diaminobutyrate acetyltransferase n=1 Tax=Tuberibacillus sp. Marseille-P3662 TaxID=1965358 RepID=UPI0020CAA73A|nr:diaminobutyrate acetyltransferase [Tuberibacillus sp. Marseille-P3662]